MEIPSDIESIQRLALAMVAGIVLGFERRRANKPAGIRTYMLVVEGAALFMILSILVSGQVMASGHVSDPTRIASTVVQGIGFIAGGLILTQGKSVKNLTTAAGIWVAAAIGLLIGAGFFVLGAVATIATVVSVTILHEVEVRFDLKDE
ncbi:MAG: MgtC/SapB family protein [Thermomicrobiales bacterium]